MIAAMAMVIAACASSPDVGDGVPAGLPVRPIPAKVGIVELDKSETLPRGAGIVHRYRDGRFRPDVFLYGKEGSEDIRMQAYEFIESLKFRRVFGRFDSFRVLLDEPITVTIGNQTFPAHEIVAQIRSRAQWYDTYFSVIALPDQFVKFRITQPRSDQTPVRSREFVNGWLTAYLAGEDM
jgi:hypothetical protein